MKKFLTCFLLVAVASFSAWPATGTEIDRQRESLSDTEFYRWLKEYRPDTPRLAVERLETLIDSDRSSDSERLEWYRDWTRREDVPRRPVDQVVLALRQDRQQLARSWLSGWLRSGSGGSGTYQSMVDSLVDAQMWDWALEVIREARSRFNRPHHFFRRAAAIYQSTDRPAQALDQYLRAFERYRRSGYVKSRVMTLLRNKDLDEELLQRVREITNSGDRLPRLVRLVEEYLADDHKIDRLTAWYGDLYGDRDRAIRRADTAVDHFLDTERIEQARELSGWLLSEEQPGNEFLLRHGDIETRLNRPDSAVRTLDRIDTATMTADQGRTLKRIRAEIAIRTGEHDRAKRLLDDLGETEATHDLWIEWFHSNNQYEQLRGYLDRQDLERPVLRFLTDFKRGQFSDSDLRDLVDREYRDRGTALALAVVGMSDSEPARQMMRWLDRFPFQSRIEGFPPEELWDAGDRLPRVLIDRWYRRFDAGDTSAESLVDLGERLDFPPLILEGARRHHREGRTERAVSTLEDILIDYPESMIRSRVESYIDQWS